MFQESKDEVTIETINHLFALNATLNNNNSSSTGATTEMFLKSVHDVEEIVFQILQTTAKREFNTETNIDDVVVQ